MGLVNKATPNTQSHVQDTTRIVFQWVIVFDLAKVRTPPHPSPVPLDALIRPSDFSRPTHGGFYAKSEPNSGCRRPVSPP